MKPNAAARYRAICFHFILMLAFLSPFILLFTALPNIDNVSSFGMRIGPRLHGKVNTRGVKLARDFYKIMNQIDGEEISNDIILPDSFTQLVSDMNNNQYDAITFAMILKAMMIKLERETAKASREASANKHVAASSIPRSIHCLSLRMSDEYLSNPNARKSLPSLHLRHILSNNSYHHFVLSTDNILAASVVVSSAIRSSSMPEKIVFHVITDKKTYAAMHSWFSLNPASPAIVEVKGIHQFEQLTRENIPVLSAVASNREIRNYYHGNHIVGANLKDFSPRNLYLKLRARSPKYFSLLNHVRIYLPELFPDLDKVVFVDDDIVIQRDLSPLWDIDLHGKVNGAVETCRGKDKFVMSKRFRNYFDFSVPLIAKNLDPQECAWAYGMNIFDLRAWKKTNIIQTYNLWMRENIKSGLSLWELGSLPPSLIAFRGHVHPIDPLWHMLGLGYHNNTSICDVQRAAVIHYNGQLKPWLQIGFDHLRPFWSKHVNYSSEFFRSCHILAELDMYP